MLKLGVGKIVFGVLLLVFSSIPAIAGNDLTVVCPANNNECQLVENLVLFDAKNIAPGYISSPRKLTVINNNPKEECLLAMRTSSVSGSAVLLKGVTFSATDANHVWYAGSLGDMGLGNEKVLGAIPPKEQNSYQLTASLNQNLGNEYQGLTTGFNLDLNFTCQIPTPTPTMPTQTTRKDEPLDEGQVLGSAAGNSTCKERVPQPPILMTTIPGENSITLVWQESTDPLTYYLVAYGTDPKRYDYGNPNVGGYGTTEYVVGGLSAATTYYFAVRAGNGCAPGSFSNQLPGTPTGKTINQKLIPRGFQNAIMGDNNFDTSIPKPEYFQSKNKILGINTENYKPKLYMIPPVLLYLFASFYRTKKKKKIG